MDLGICWQGERGKERERKEGGGRRARARWGEREIQRETTIQKYEYVAHTFVVDKTTKGGGLRQLGGLAREVWLGKGHAAGLTSMQTKIRWVYRFTESRSRRNASKLACTIRVGPRLWKGKDATLSRVVYLPYIGADTQKLHVLLTSGFGRISMAGGGEARCAEKCVLR